MEEQRANTIQQAVDKIRLLNLKGALRGPVYLTPQDVKGTSRVGWEYLECAVLTRNSKLVAPGIFLSRVIFPEFCSKCMKPATRFELAEGRIPVRRISARKQIYFPNLKNAEDSSRIIYASHFVRIWFAVPFCRDHDLGSGALHIRATTGPKKTKELRLNFANREYGMRFAEANDLEGKWFDKFSIIKRLTFGLFFTIIFTALSCGLLSTCGYLVSEERLPEPSEVLQLVAIGVILAVLAFFAEGKKHFM